MTELLRGDAAASSTTANDLLQLGAPEACGGLQSSANAGVARRAPASRARRPGPVAGPHLLSALVPAPSQAWWAFHGPVPFERPFALLPETPEFEASTQTIEQWCREHDPGYVHEVTRPWNPQVVVPGHPDRYDVSLREVPAGGDADIYALLRPRRKGFKPLARPIEQAGHRICNHCGELFLSTKSSRRHCSEACKNAAKQKRYRDKNVTKDARIADVKRTLHLSLRKAEEETGIPRSTLARLREAA